MYKQYNNIKYYINTSCMFYTAMCHVENVTKLITICS